MSDPLVQDFSEGTRTLVPDSASSLPAVSAGGRTTSPTPAAAPVASPAFLAADAALAGEAVVVAPLPRSDWPAALADRAQSDPLAERVNKFTIDDEVVSWSRPDDVPRQAIERAWAAR